MVDVHNPIDLTPMAGDAAYEDSLRAVMESDGIDIGIVGCRAADRRARHAPGRARPRQRSRAGRTASACAWRALHATLDKAFVAVVDAGAVYDPFVSVLERHGIPTFRTADTALRLLNVFVASRRRAAATDR